MPKHLTQEKKWTNFLHIISDIKSLKVTKVDDNDICLTLEDSTDLALLDKLLSSPNLLKEKVMHIIANDDQNLDTSAPEGKLNNAQTIAGNPTAILEKIFSKDFLDEVGFKASAFDIKDNSILKELEFTFAGTEARAQLEEAKLKMLKCSMDDKEKIQKITLGYENPISIESECHDNTFGKQIVSISNNKVGDKALLQAKFSYGKLLQGAQADNPDDSAPIIIADQSGGDTIYTINKDYLIRYLDDLFNGMVFDKEEAEGYRPYMFSVREDSELKTDPYFHFILDKSGSMGSHLTKYKTYFTDVISKVFKEVPDAKFTITLFSTNIESQNFFGPDSLEMMISFINNIEARGATNLHGALHSGISQIADKDATIILFTDGYDNFEQYTENDLISQALEARAQNPNFSLYTMSLENSSNTLFFNNLAQNIGCTHINLDNVSAMSEFNEYLSFNFLGVKPTLVSFLKELEVTAREQVAPNEITVGQTLVDKDTQIFWKGTTLRFGVEKMLSSIGSAINKCVGDCLDAAVDYAQYVVKDSPSYFSQQETRFPYRFDDEFNATGVCPAYYHDSIQSLGDASNISGYLG